MCQDAGGVTFRILRTRHTGVPPGTRFNGIPDSITLIVCRLIVVVSARKSRQKMTEVLSLWAPETRQRLRNNSKAYANSVNSAMMTDGRNKLLW